MADKSFSNSTAFQMDILRQVAQLSAKVDSILTRGHHIYPEAISSSDPSLVYEAKTRRIESRLSQIEQRLERHEARIKLVEDMLKLKEEQKSSLSGQMEVNMKGVRERMYQLEVAVATNQETIFALERELELSSRNATGSLKALQESLSANLTEANRSVWQHQEQLAQLATDVRVLHDQMHKSKHSDDLIDEVHKIEGDITTLSHYINEVHSARSDQDAAIIALRRDMNTLHQSVVAVSSDMKEVSSAHFSSQKLVSSIDILEKEMRELKHRFTEILRIWNNKVQSASTFIDADSSFDNHHAFSRLSRQ